MEIKTFAPLKFSREVLDMSYLNNITLPMEGLQFIIF
jgi:hypothetical protein